MAPPHHNAFGAPIVAPAQLTRAERIALLRSAARQMREAGEIDGYVIAWLGLVLQAHLETGADLEGLLGIKPERGCTRTAQKLIAAEKHEHLLLKLAAAVGSDRKAVRVLAGKVPCPPRARPILDELALSPGGKSLRAFGRARTAHRG